MQPRWAASNENAIHLVDVPSKVLLSVALVRVERNLNLMRQSVQKVWASREQSAISGDNGYKTFVASHQHKLRQQRMEEWFAHQMEIQKLHLALKLRGQSVEFVQRQRMLRPLGLRAEHTAEVTHISYFEIASCYHIGS